MGSLEQALRTSRTSKTARAITSSTARTVRLGTASMVTQPDGPFVNLARLNIEKYASDPNLNRQLFEYVFYQEGDMKVAHQIAATATKTAEFNNWYWKNALGKCYFRLGMMKEAEQQFTSSLKNFQVVETFAYLAKIFTRLDQPIKAISKYLDGLTAFPNDITLLVGLARIQERIGRIDDSIETYKTILKKEPNNVEATACIGTHYFYNDNPEVALKFYRRILQMGVYSAEIYMNIGLCCFYCLQMDMSIGCIEKAHKMADDDNSADIWYNTGHIAMAIGDLVMAIRCFKLAIAADSEHAESLCNLGGLRLREGKPDEAKTLFLSAAAKGPHLFEPSYNLALMYYQSGQFSESRKYVEKALYLFPTHASSLALHKNIKNLYEMI
ncbi:hypothetical protein L596_005702 [Steinernema carpocapsae]|uniref:Uncharacterized protein n=1 Tax=Steinernema carpocapsae TaxID=34508 RepID=A0A4U8V1G4_STECR|nr:hypothetical protein L596_005702 [Steinernema carpocapsae]